MDRSEDSAKMGRSRYVCIMLARGDSSGRRGLVVVEMGDTWGDVAKLSTSLRVRVCQPFCTLSIAYERRVRS